MKSLVSLLAVWWFSLSLQAAVLEAIPTYTVGTAQGGYVPGGAGFAFSPVIDMSVTALGFNGSGLTNGGYRVSLWANGIPLLSVVVTLNSTLINQTYYQTVPSTQLLRGQTYYLSAAATNNNYWTGNLISTNFGYQYFSSAADIGYLGTAYGTNLAGGFPVATGDISSYYVGPNFQYRPGFGTNLIWAGILSSQWDIAASLNWFNPSINRLDLFNNGASVQFNDRYGVATTINIGPGAAVKPTVITNNSSVNNFVISGSGSISGSTVVVKDGSSALTLGTANDYTGDTLVLGGIVKVANPSALGSTNGLTLITNGATLDLNGVGVAAEPVVVSGDGVAGAGAIVNNGPPAPMALRRVRLAGDTTFGGTNGWDLGGAGYPASLLSGGQPWKLTKVGSNQVSFVEVTQIDGALGDIDIQQGTFSLQSTTAQLGNPSRTITVGTNASLSLSNLAATPLNKRIVLRDRATVYNEGGPSVVAGRVTLEGVSIFMVSSNGTIPTLTFTNTLLGTGAVAKLGEGTLVLSASNTYSGSTLVGKGTLALAGSGSISVTPEIRLNGGTVLDVSKRSDGGFTLASGQTLSGSGTVLGSLTASVGSTVSPGTVIGQLAVSNDVVLQGTTYMELDKFMRINDVLLSRSNLLYGGTLQVTNLDGVLRAGDKFKLFDASSYAGAFTNVVPTMAALGLAWDTNQLITNGILGVVRAPPAITNIAWTGAEVVIAGTNGMPTNSYYVLTTTNLALPLTNWTRLTTNLFSPLGTFIFTNAFDPTVPEEFYLLQLP